MRQKEGRSVKQHVTREIRRWVAVCLAAAALPLAACGAPEKSKNLISQEKEEERIVNLFSPMEKTDPDAENVARSASDLTVAMAEEAPLLPNLDWASSSVIASHMPLPS